MASPIDSANRPGGGQPAATRTQRLDLAAYRVLTACVAPAARAILRWRQRAGKEDPRRLPERLGQPSLPRGPGPLAWLHAASVGEANAVLPLIAGLRARRPDLAIVLTTGTVTSARFVAGRLPVGAVHQFVPLDAPAFVARFLDHWRPDLAVFTEQEIWPNLLLEASRRAIPLALVNARMSDRSFARWQRRRGLAGALFSRFAIVLAQNDVLAHRFETLGAARTIAAGNIKIDAPPLPVDATAYEALATALADRPRLVAASTHAGEELILGEAHREIARHLPGFCTILVPRHPERGPQVAEGLKAAGFKVAQRSIGDLPTERTDIYIADTLGELGTLYAVAPLAFIGGSLIAHGGQNPIEAVRRGAGVITGPSWANFADAYRALIAAGGAIEAGDSAAIATTVRHLLADPAALQALQANALGAVDALSGALERTLAALLPLLPPAAEGSSHAA